MILLNDDVYINCMSESLTQTWWLKIMFRLAVKAKVFQIDLTRLINVYKATIKLINDADREHISTQIFYTFSKISQNIIVKLFWMMKINFSVDWITFIWRFELVRNKIIINSLEKFLKSKNKVSMFAFVCNNFDADSAQ